MDVAGVVLGAVGVLIAIVAFVDARLAGKRSESLARNAMDKLNVLVGAVAQSSDIGPVRARLDDVRTALLAAIAAGPRTVGSLLDPADASLPGTPEQRFYCLNELERSGELNLDGSFKQGSVVRLAPAKR